MKTDLVQNNTQPTDFAIQLSGVWKDSPTPGYSIFFFLFMMAEDARLLLLMLKRRNGVKRPAVFASQLIPLKQTKPLRISIKFCNRFSLTKEHFPCLTLMVFSFLIMSQELLETRIRS